MDLPNFSNPHQNMGSLIGHTGRAWRRVVDYRLQPFGLTDATWLPLLYLSRGRTPMCQKELARAVGIDTSTLVRLLDALVQAGLVERKSDGDRRKKMLGLTPRGVERVRQVEETTQALRKEVLAGISESDLETARAIVERIYTALQKACPPEGSAEPRHPAAS